MARTARLKSIDEGARPDAQTWTTAALEVLAEQGIDGVRIEVLAKRIGFTKGSFYWHFKDREALFDAMLDEWRRKTTLDIIARLERSDKPSIVRVRNLLRLPLAGQKSDRALDLDLAIRIWGRRHPKARAAMEEIDQLRLSHLSGLLEGCGIKKEEAAARAILAYAYMGVAGALVGSRQTELMTRCENILLGA